MAIESKLKRPEIPAYQPPGMGSPRSKKSMGKPLGILILLIIIALVGYLGWKQFGEPKGDIVDGLADENEPVTVSDGAYQAVFLDNGQVYFGRLLDRDGEFYRLEDVYYLEFRANPQSGEPAPNDADVSLIKLGSEVHGPEAAMDINRAHIMFIEDLKGDSKVAKAIAEHMKNNKK